MARYYLTADRKVISVPFGMPKFDLDGIVVPYGSSRMSPKRPETQGNVLKLRGRGIKN